MAFGLAKTDNFLLNTASVMIGPQADLYSLNDSHAIGLVKDFQINSDPSYTELTQGVRNDIVYSTLTNNPVRATMNVFEYTPKNMSYALGLDPDLVADTSPDPVALKASITAAATALTFDAASDVSADWPAGSWITIKSVSNPAQTHVAKISSTTHSTGVQTVNFLGYAIPTGVTFAIGDEISMVKRISVGDQAEQPFFAAKVVSALPNGKNLVLLLPKVRIVKGFSLGFNPQDYGSMPFEFTCYNLVSTDPNYAAFATRKADLLIE